MRARARAAAAASWASFHATPLRWTNIFAFSPKEMSDVFQTHEIDIIYSDDNWDMERWWWRHHESNAFSFPAEMPFLFTTSPSPGRFTMPSPPEIDDDVVDDMIDMLDRLILWRPMILFHSSFIPAARPALFLSARATAESRLRARGARAPALFAMPALPPMPLFSPRYYAPTSPPFSIIFHHSSEHMDYEQRRRHADIHMLFAMPLRAVQWKCVCSAGGRQKSARVMSFLAKKKAFLVPLYFY